MFWNPFIATLYHCLGLTYWHSAQCQLLCFACFLLRRISVPNGVQTQRNFLENFYGPEDTRGAKKVPEGGSEGITTYLGAPRGPGAPWWVVPTSVASRTASLLYKYPNIPETLGESRKINSSRRKFQIQSRHHHGGVHHPHWCGPSSSLVPLRWCVGSSL